MEFDLMKHLSEIEVTVNGIRQKYNVPTNMTLLDLIRGQIGLTGTKRGCDQGQCGTCTVLLDGEPVNACLVLAPMADGKSVETVESLAVDGTLHALQKAFIEEGAVQCGFCTPGMLMSAKALLVESANPSRAQVREGLAGNLCRCTGYERVFAAVSRAVDALKAATHEP